MTDRPILFSASMVRAILAGQKTQTRRLVKPQPPAECTHLGPVIGTYSGAAVPRFYWKTAEDYEAAEASGVEYVFWPAAHDEESDGFTGDVYGAGGLLCPYGSEANCMKHGDRLWVRESYRLCTEFDDQPPSAGSAANRVWYEADAPHQPGAGKGRPSIHMPRWASRITLNITGVRVERLQDISEADAMAEGVQAKHTSDADYSARDAFRVLWESINGGGSWDANPWVWVVEFERTAAAALAPEETK